MKLKTKKFPLQLQFCNAKKKNVQLQLQLSNGPKKK